jgi:lambda repressor-like predicted transcriptional regulator
LTVWCFALIALKFLRGFAMTQNTHDTLIAVPAELSTSAFQAAAPIILALCECEEELRKGAIELFQQLASGQLDQEQRFATTALIAEILFPNTDDKGIPGLDLVEAEEIAPKAKPESKAVLAQMDKDEEFFARRLGELMEAKHFSQAELAAKVGIGQPAVSMMLNRTCRPQRKTVLRFAEALGVVPEELWPPFRKS